MKKTICSGLAALSVFFTFTSNAKPIAYDEVIKRSGFEVEICEALNDCHYVSVSGTSKNSCTYSDPCDLQTAKSHLSGGDHLYLFQGIYEDAQLFTEGAYGDEMVVFALGRNHSFMDPQPSDLLRIRIQSYPGHTVIIDGNYDIDQNSGAECFYIDQSFITISDLHFHDCKIAVNIGQNRITEDVLKILVENNLFTGTHFVADNAGSISVYFFSLDAVIQNNNIAGPGSSLGSMNSAGIYFTKDRGIQILHNEIHQHKVGIHYKHDNFPDLGDTGSVLAWNYVYDTDIATRLNNRNLFIHDNIFAETAGSFSLNHCSGFTGEGGDRNRITNNHFHSLNFNGCSDTDNDQGAYQNTLKNNIIISRFYLHPWNSTAHDTLMDFNLYGDGIFSNNQFFDLPSWQITYGQDSSSLSGLPSYNSPNLNNIMDYKLSTGSLGYQADENGSNMGPDVESVGIKN